MSSILLIESSTEITSTALSVDGKIVYEKETRQPNSHTTLLAPYVENALNFFSEEFKDQKIDAIAVSGGPGSYTGLRIGVALAKGLCYGFNVPLIAIDTLMLMTHQLISQYPDSLFCPMIDARRMEVYCAIYNAELDTLRPISADIIDDQSFIDYLSSNKVCFFGNGAKKCRGIITHPNALFIDNIVPLASQMSVLAQQMFDNGQFEDVAYYEPHYLKEFVAKVSVNKVLHG
ncbi:MAG: tRNA (adenosine(37)-N6)-threonylcarbamoyltransferase complex dimerization subunit type 1 TsaB [Bacteroidales bacterium]